MGLATFAFNTSTYFKYNGKLYKWLDGTALASQASVVVFVAGTLIQNIQERATIFLLFHMSLCCVEKRPFIAFSRSGFHD